MEVVEIPSSFTPNFARGLNILLVDDDTAFLVYLASLLEQYTYNVTTTRLASVALSMIREDKDRFKLVMANVNVPDMDGHKFMRQLFRRKIPVIAMSSERSVSAACKAMKAGASLCLDKPISLYDLKYLWQYVFEKTTICRMKVNIRKKSEGLVVRDEGRKTQVPNGIIFPAADGYQIVTVPGSKGNGQVVGFKDLDTDINTRQQIKMTGLEAQALKDGHDDQQMIKADPNCKGKQIEGEMLNGGTTNYDQQMIIPNANSGNKGNQFDIQVLHGINDYNQLMTQLKRKIGVEQVAMVKENFNKEAESNAMEMSMLAEIQKQDHESVITKSQQQSGSKRPTDDGGRQNGDRRVEANSEIIMSSSGKKIRVEKRKQIECNKGEETERFKSNIYSDSSTEKRPRLIWNQDLQKKFMSAITALGDQRARPKKILEKMNVSYLSQRQVSSHLQKYKAQIRRIYDHATIDSSALHEPSPYKNGTGVPLLEKTCSGRPGQVENEGSDYGIEGDKSEILKVTTDGVNQDIHFSCLSGNKNNAPLMSTGTSQGQQSYGGEHFTIEKVANAIKLATSSTARNQKLDCIKPPNPTSGNVSDTIKFPTISTDENHNLDPKVSNPNPYSMNNTDEFMTGFNEVLIQELDSIAVSGPLSYSLNQSQSHSDFPHTLSFLEEEPINFNCLTDQPNQDEVARYIDSISELLFGNNSPQP